MHYYLDVLKKYATFDGRAGRGEYWMFTLINAIVLLIVWAVSRDLYYLYALAILLPSLAVSVRRLHDTSHSGWWILIGLIPFIGAIILLVWLVTDSSAGTNQYGGNPKGVMAAAPATASAPPRTPGTPS